MKTLKSFVLIPLIGAFLCACGAAGGGGTDISVNDVGNVEGTVTDVSTGNPLSGVTVQVGDKSDVTGDSGVYSIQDIDVGTRTVTASITGYQNHNGTCEISKGTTVSHDIQLIANTSSDTIPPMVSSTSPANNETGVIINSTLTATFSETMDSSTVTTATFTLKQGTTPASGTVTYTDTTATFTPSSNLADSTTYTATITTGVKDAAGNAMVSDYTWTFTTASAPGASFRMPDTNQTTSYTDTFGEDSDYTINPPSYTDNGDGTITDNVTGLMWQKQDDATTRIWNNAVTSCDDLDLGGQTDWRLPSQIELISITDYGVYEPAINTTFFPGTSSSYYWSSTTYAADTSESEAWGMTSINGSWSYSSKANSNYVRCVRGEQATPNLTDNGNGTVTDNGTLLIWQQGESSTMMWEAALTYCEDLSLGGSTDWRLPNIKELSSIVDYTRYNPSINTTLFPNAIFSSYWSSTTLAYYTPNAWYVYFGPGDSQFDGKTAYSRYVRCVRGGQ